MEQPPVLKQKLSDDLKQAMRSGDKVGVSTIRLVLSAVKNAEIAKMAALTDSDILGIIAKEARQRDESIVAFKQGNRPDLVAKEEAELAYLKKYLPQQASKDEIIAEAKRIIAEVGAQGPRDKGKVMPKLVAQFKGKADGRQINEVVTELLGS
ncbi:MAG: GatB/YqeY domain-containing protein [Dehalococcoidales bacterium]|nr:GatB/YqeY domain-containing protein [Dehalococcoidales bacterium]